MKVYTCLVLFILAYVSVCFGNLTAYPRPFDWIPEENHLIFSEAERVLEQARAKSDNTLLARYWFLKGFGYFLDQHPFLSEDAFRNAIQTQQVEEDERFLQTAWMFVARSLAVQEHYEKSEVAWNTALALASSRADDYARAICHLEIGQMELTRKNPQQASKHFLQAAEIFGTTQRVGNAEKRADIWLLLSSISRTEDEDPQTALELAQQAMEVYDSCGIPDKFVKAMLFATLALNDLERFEECFDYLEKSRELIIARQTDTLESAFFEYVQGETHFSQGMYKQAIQHFTTSLQLLTPFAAAERDLLVKVWQRILACYAASGNVSAYDETVDAYTAFFNGLNQERAEYTRKELVVLYGTREKSEELKKLNTKIAGLDQSIIDAIRLSRRKSWLIGMLVVAILTLTGLLTLSNVNTTNKSLKIQLFTMKRSLLKHDIPVFPSMGKEQETVNQKSGVENLNSEDSQFLKELFDRICQVMEKEMLYLKPDLNIDALSERVGYGSVQVSNAINSIGHMNFSAFVNQYRVKKSKRLIEHVKESESLSFSDVASMSGFQSYRTFYRVFKKHTEQTPREYRNAYWNK